MAQWLPPGIENTKPDCVGFFMIFLTALDHDHKADV